MLITNYLATFIGAILIITSAASLQMHSLKSLRIMEERDIKRNKLQVGLVEQIKNNTCSKKISPEEIRYLLCSFVDENGGVTQWRFLE